MRVQAPRIKIRPDTEHATVSPLELFFDLVFVFALTQVTAFMAHDLSWLAVLRGVLIIMLLWWAWTGYAWLANVASADENDDEAGHPERRWRPCSCWPSAFPRPFMTPKAG